MRFLIRKLHKWLGLLIGAQILLWLSGGVVMSLLPIELVRGTTWVRQVEQDIGEHASRFTLAPSAIAPGATPILELSTAIRLGEPVYLLREAGGGNRIVHAVTGAIVPPLSDTQASQLASSLHRDQATPISTQRIDAATSETRGLTLPLVRVNLADRWHSRVYLDPFTARVVAVRNDIWRIYDFFWMLHIMDYAERDDFNNNLLRTASGFGWLAGLSGLWLLFYSFRWRPGARGPQKGSST